jgi:hypothetical protein
MANTSPRKASRGSSTTLEFRNPGSAAGSPAAARAAGDAGMTPPLARMASRLRAAPSAVSTIPGTRQLATRNTAPTG